MDPIYEAYQNAYDAAVNRAIKIDMPKRKLLDWENEIVQGIIKATDGMKSRAKAVKSVVGFLAARGKPWTYAYDYAKSDVLYIYDKAGKEVMKIY